MARNTQVAADQSAPPITGALADVRELTALASPTG